MDNHTILLGLSVALWLFLVYRFIRALKNGKVAGRTSLHTWAIFFLIYLVALLTVNSVEMWIDGHFGNLPVTTLSRCLLMLAAVLVFYLGIENVYARRPKTAEYLVRLTVVDAGICIGLFVWFAIYRPTSTVAIINLLKDFRDVMMVAWTVLIFIPFSVYLWKQEQVRPMKLHRALDLGFWACFLTESVTGMALSLAAVSTSSWGSNIWTLDRLSTYMCYILILVTLLPYRWLLPLFYPRKVLLYWRLKRLQSTVKRWSATQPSLPGLPLNLKRPDEIELAIYQTLIAILDTYPSMFERGRALQEQIQQVVEAQPTYGELVRRIASIRI